MKFSTLALPVSIAGGLMLAACTTPGAVEAREEQREEMAEIENEEGMVCEMEQIPGSLRRQRVCRDPDEMQRDADEGRAATDRYQRSIQPPSGG